MTNEIETLNELKRQVESAMAYVESGLPMHDMTVDEKRRFAPPFAVSFNYDFVIGDFGIVRLKPTSHT